MSVLNKMTTLYTTFFVPKEAKRLQELLETLRHNSQDARIDSIHIMTEEPQHVISDIAESKHAKIQWHFLSDRPTFQDLYRIAADDHGIIILANSDIYFGRGLENTNTLQASDALALSRFDKRADGKLVPYHKSDSQDAWIIRGPPKNIQCHFSLGIPGCDNRLAHELKQAGYSPVNACNDFEIIHCHASNLRTYTRKQTVSPPYLQLQPRPKGYWRSMIRSRGDPIVRPRALEAPEPHIEAPMEAPTDPTEAEMAPPIPKEAPGQLCLAPRASWTITSVVHAGLPVDMITKAFKSVASQYTYIPMDPRTTFNERLLAHVSEAKPKLLFMQIQTPDVLKLDTLRALTSHVETIVNWTGDVRAPLPQWYYDVGALVTHTLFSSTTDARTLRRAGQPADFLQIGFDNDVYVPSAIEYRKRSNIVFMGNNYTNRFPLSQFRYELVHTIHRKYGKKFVLQGGNWPSVLCSANTTFNPKAEIKTLQSVAIAVSVSHFQYERYYSDRLLRFMACGPLVLQHWYPGIEMDFTPDKHLVVFHNITECMEKLDYYLKHPNEAAQIAEAGCRHVHENHTQKVRMNELQALINGASAMQ